MVRAPGEQLWRQGVVLMTLSSASAPPMLITHFALFTPNQLEELGSSGVGR